MLFPADPWHEMLNLFYCPPISLPPGTAVKP
jgi:hypothetical protein